MKTFLSSKNLCLSLAILFVVGYAPANAQSELRGSAKLIEQGIKVYDTGNYKQAINFFQQVAEGDTNYLLAQYELGLAYNADSMFNQAVVVAQKALDYPESEQRIFLILLGNTYDYLGKTDSAMNCYKKLMVMNPFDHQPFYEMGVVYLRKEQMDSAIYYLEKAVMLNPYHFRSLKLLATCYGLQGRLTESWICLQSSLLIANNYSMAQVPINLLDGIVKQTDEFSKAYQNKKEQYQHPLFDELDAIIHAKVILGSEYEIKSVLNDEPQAKTLYAILEKIKYNAKDNNFTMQYFAPLWLEIKEKKLIDPFLLHLYSGYDIEKVEKLAAKDKSNITKARDLSINYLRLISATHVLNFEERKKAPLKFSMINSDNLLISCNLKNFEEFTEGPAKVYKAGTLAAVGKFNNKGKKEGLWTYYYPSGKVKTIEHLKDGVLIGEEQKFYKSGILKSKTRYIKEGESQYEASYTENGVKNEEYELMADKSIRNVTFHPNGAKRFYMLIEKGVYKAGAYEGYYDNAKASRAFNIKDGKLDGIYKEFYEDGAPKGVFHYKDGKLDGEYKLYHQNGKSEVTCFYKEGEREGLYEGWDNKGRQVDKQTYKQGKLEGKCYFFDEGKEYGFVNYVAGKATEYEFKDLKGNLVAADKGPLKTIRHYFSNGNLQSEYPLKEGKVNGTAKFYNYGGSLREEVNYVNDQKEGLEKNYYPNGKLNFEAVNKSDERTGYYKGYNLNGKPVAEGWLENNTKEGIWKYNNSNGLLSSKCFYLNGEIAGFNEEYNVKGELVIKDFYTEKANCRMLQFDSTGKEFNRIDFVNGNGKYVLKYQGTNKVWFESPLENGLLEGEFKKYYPDGSIREEGSNHHGFRKGKYSFYDYNGRKTIVGTYENGKTEGQWIYLKSNGDTNVIANYKEGMSEGKKYTYENGVVNYESNYRNNVRDGEQYIYDHQKKMAVVMNFDEGILKSYTYLGKDGKLLPPIEVKNGTAAVNAFYENGNKSIEFNYFENKQHGSQKFYTSEGRLFEERNYNYGEVNGAWKEYHPDGKIRLSCNYLDDQYHGTYEEFDENGEKILSNNYYYGALHGYCESYDPNTKKKAIMTFRYGYPVNKL